MEKWELARYLIDAKKSVDTMLLLMETICPHQKQMTEFRLSRFQISQSKTKSIFQTRCLYPALIMTHLRISGNRIAGIFYILL